jgi:hypothetical protein
MALRNSFVLQMGREDESIHVALLVILLKHNVKHE